MDEDNPQQKSSGLKSSRSDSQESASTTAIESGPSASVASLQTGSRRGSTGLVRSRSALSARQSPSPEPTMASSSARDLLSVQTSQDSLPLIAAEESSDQASDSGIWQAEPPHDPNLGEETLAGTNAGFEGIRRISGMVQNTVSGADNLRSVPDAVDTFSEILRPLRVFGLVANGLANVHPYAKVPLGIFTCASKMILEQADPDPAISRLLVKISEVYVFTTGEETLAKIQPMLTIYGQIAQQTLECADFITHHSQMKRFWERLGKHVTDETDAMIQSFSEALDGLMQKFQDQATGDAVSILHAGEDLDTANMAYVSGAGLNISKCCLPGTREVILSEIKSWICSTGDDVPRILWLSGTAGAGKSAIAHTIADWYDEQGGLGACFCFDRTQQADRRQDKIFTTIASDLADCNPIMRRALAQAIHDNNGLKRTPGLTRQWRELVVGPTGIASEAIAVPVLIVIDALNESGNPKSREQILRLLAGELNTSPSQLSNIPAHFRILVTSRPLEDIREAMDTASHVRCVSMDNISRVFAERDIQLYISTRLAGPPSPFDDGHFRILAQKSDGLFEWVRLACDYIKNMTIESRGQMLRFRAVVSGTSDKATHLLDDMYARILAEIMPEDECEEVIPVFRSVMGHILASVEPLPMPVLMAMRLHFPDVRDHYKLERIIQPLGSLLTGTTDSRTPIRPLHASFYNFLTDKSRSKDFFVDTSLVQSNLAFASLRVMDSEHGLRFNICSLESSYLPNSSVPDLEKRVKESITAELSYSCRFWGTHVGATSLEPLLAKEVEAFFNGERLLWWLEALALMKNLGGSVDSLSRIAGWVMGNAEYTHIGDAARDTQRFVRTFAPTILRSTPHLYLSALPFAPTQSRIFRKFAEKFPRTPCIFAGHVVNWPQIEKIIHANDMVCSVAMSPNGKRIACGLDNGAIQVWDADTGEALGSPLQGHAGRVASVTFSLDGMHIVSGSWDKTVRVWDAATGKALGVPLQGHTDSVNSVAISRYGNHIVSGSDDCTIRVWNMETGEALGAPIQGHTSYVTSVAISWIGNLIVSGSNDTTIRVWDIETGQALGVPLRGHTGSVESVAISPNGKHIVSGSNDNTIRVWDMENGEAFGAPLQGHPASVQSVAISSDGKRIVSGSVDQTIRVWDMKTGEPLGPPLQGHTSSVPSVTISPDGTRIVSSSYDNTIRVWDMTGEVFAPLYGHTASVQSVTLSPDGKHIVSGSRDKTIQVWDMETGGAFCYPLQGHTDSIESVTISSNGNIIASGSADKTIRVWDMGTGEALGAPLRGHDGAVCSVALSSDGHHIVSGSDDKTVRVWDMKTGKTLGVPLQGHTDTVYSVAISPDGNNIVSSSRDKSIRLWDAETREAFGVPFQGHADGVRSSAISPDGHHIVSGSDDKMIRVWDIETGNTLDALGGHTARVRSVVISPNGKFIVSGSDDKTIQVWDVTRRALGASLLGHTANVLSLAISPDGKSIVSGSDDTTIRVWDVAFLYEEKPKAPPIRFSSNPTHALHSATSFLQDGSVSASVDMNVDGWVVGPEGRLLLWIPLAFHLLMYAQGNTLVIPNHASQFDLSRFAHGKLWHKCRKQEAGWSS